MARVSDEVLAEACQAIRAWDSTRPDADEPPLYQTLRAAALDLEEARAADKDVRAHLCVIASILEDEDCQCMDPPEDRDEDDERGNDPDDPSAHAAYCPIYLHQYLANLVAGKPHPDPDHEWAIKREADATAKG